MATPSKSAVLTPELAAAICERLAAGESLLTIEKTKGMPSRETLAQWVIEDRDGFGGDYARARNKGLDVLAEQALEIADTPVEGEKTKTVVDAAGDTNTEVTKGDMIEHRRLQVDTRKWYLSKLAPKRYGERSALEVTGADGAPLFEDDAAKAARIAAILTSAQQRKTDDEFSDLL